MKGLKKMNFDEFDLSKLDTMTKYPSILTYHALGDHKTLLPGFVQDTGFNDDEMYYGTEKVDGTNTRIVLLNDDFMVGSRDRLLYRKGQDINNLKNVLAKTVDWDITHTVAEIAKNLSSKNSHDNCLRIAFGETYGNNITQGSRNYVNDKECAFRLFDLVTEDEETVRKIIDYPIDKIAGWRNHDHQHFVDVDELTSFAEANNLNKTPYLFTIKGNEIPKTLNDVLDWLQQFSKTKAGINAIGKAEGVVIRSKDRSFIRKLRFEDYEKTLRKYPERFK
jgi:hypothetical protein